MPEILCFYEFKFILGAVGRMSFIYVDYEESRIIDIVEDRRKASLIKHFNRYPKSFRCNVKFIVIDSQNNHLDYFGFL